MTALELLNALVLKRPNAAVLLTDGEEFHDLEVVPYMDAEGRELSEPDHIVLRAVK